MRRLLAQALTVIAFFVIAAPTDARAETPLKLVVPFAAGGTLDALARLLAQQLNETYKENAIVENRPGASGTIGTRYVIQAPTDGRTLLMGVSAVVVSVFTDQGNYDPRKDLAPVIFLTDSDNFLVANPRLGVRTTAELVALARQRPNGLTCAGPGGQMKLGCEQLRVLLDGRVLTIPYQGLAPATQAVLAGDVDFMFAPRTSAVPLAQDKKWRILASAGNRPPDPPLQDLPLVKETLPGVVMDSVIAVYAPARTPEAVIQKLNAQLNAILRTPAVSTLLSEQGYRVVGGPPEVLGKFTADQYDYYSRLVKAMDAISGAAR